MWLSLGALSNLGGWCIVYSVKRGGWYAILPTGRIPTSAITRMFPVRKRPSDVVGWENKLTTIFGGEEWKELYKDDPQQTLTGEPRHLRKEDAKTISKLYQRKLKALFKDRFLNKTYEFKTRNNAMLFEFMFCVGSCSPSAIKLAKKIAGHILKKST